MRLLYSKPELRDLSQGSRISFARQFRFMSQHELADKLGITGDNKRRTMWIVNTFLDTFYKDRIFIFNWCQVI